MLFSKKYINKKDLIIIFIKKINKNKKRKRKRKLTSELEFKFKMKKKDNFFNNQLCKPNNTKTMLLLLHSTDLVSKDLTNLFKNNNKLILDKIHQF